MDSSSPPHTNDVKAAIEPIVNKGTRLGSIVSALQELAPKETTVSTKPEKDPLISAAVAQHRDRIIQEQIFVPERRIEAAKGLGSLGKREAVDTENATLEVDPDALVRSNLFRPRRNSRTEASCRGEESFPRKRSRTTPCSDGDDTHKSPSQVCSRNKRRGSRFLVNMTFRETSGDTYIFGRQSIVNQFADAAVDTQSQLFAAPRLSVNQEEQFV